jgi:hypothetical protein
MVSVSGINDKTNGIIPPVAGTPCLWQIEITISTYRRRKGCSRLTYFDRSGRTKSFLIPFSDVQKTNNKSNNSNGEIDCRCV